MKAQTALLMAALLFWPPAASGQPSLRSSAPRAVRLGAAFHPPRHVARHIRIGGDALFLPGRRTAGAPAGFDLSGLGAVDVPEEDYGTIEDQLASCDPQETRKAIALLRQLVAQNKPAAAPPKIVKAPPADDATANAATQQQDPIARQSVSAIPVVHAPVGRAATTTAGHDYAEPLSFMGAAPRLKAPGLY